MDNTKIEITFRSLGGEAPNAPITVDGDETALYALEEAWKKALQPGANVIHAIRARKNDEHVSVYLRLDLIAYMRVIRK